MSNSPPLSPQTDATAQSSLHTFKAGTRLVVENDTSSRKMFIIRSGKARVFKSYMSQKITLAVLGEGEVFGEMSFFDAEPRSASVEALTELTAIVLDGEVAQREFDGLPSWIFPIFRTVFHRFRELDAKLTVFQSINEYQKRAFKTDSVGKSIYLELLRFNKTLKLLYEDDYRPDSQVKTDEFYAALDDLLGSRSLGLRVYWRMLHEYDFLEQLHDDKAGLLLFNEQALAGLNAYLASEVSKETYLLLSHSAVAVLSRIVGFTRAQTQTQIDSGAAASDTVPVSIAIKDLALDRVPLHEEAIRELVSGGVIRVAGATFVVEPGLVFRLHTYQSMLKAFDHTMVNLD